MKKQILYIFLALFWVFSWESVSGQTSPTEKPIPVIDVKLQEHLSALDNDATEKVWVFFTDKKIQSHLKYQEALRQARQSLSEEAIERREKVKGPTNVVGFYDLPVPDEYIQDVLKVEGVVAHRTTTRWLNGISIEASPGAIAAIAKSPFVRRVKYVAQGERIVPPVLETEKRRVDPREMPTTLNYGFSYYQLEQINAIAAHERGFTGDGVRVLVLDTGFYTAHEAFPRSRIIAEYDFIFDDPVTSNQLGDDPNQHDHGTGTASIIGAAVDSKLYGPAYECDFLLAKTEDLRQEQPIEEDWYVAGLEWGEQLGADIASSSLGYNDWYEYADMDGNTAVTSVAADMAVGLGMVVATAAGNYSFAQPNWTHIVAPGDADSVITVGAVSSTGTIASFSLQGPTADGRMKPEVVARGVSTSFATTNTTVSYGSGNGTSFATPLVAGAAAQVLQAHQDWPPMLVREALMQTADNADSPDNSYGWGIINVMEAITYSLVEDIKIRVTAGDGSGALPAPGEPGYLSASITNNRVLPVQSISVEVESSSPLLQLESNTLTWNPLDGGNSAVSSNTIPVTVDSLFNPGMTLPFQVVVTATYDDYIFRDTLQVNGTLGSARILVADLDIHQQSAPQIVDDLISQGIAVEYTTTLSGETLSDYDGVFVSLGSGFESHALTMEEGAQLAEYLLGGGNLFLEGDKTWTVDQQTDVHPYFHVTGVDFDLIAESLTGVPDSPVDGHTYQLVDSEDYQFHIGEIMPTENARAWLAMPEFGENVLIAFSNQTYNTIASGFDFGGIQKMPDYGTPRIELMQAILNHLGIYFYLLKGDLNYDKNLDVTDVLYLISSVLENPDAANERDQYVGDFNGDGEVSPADVQSLTRYILAKQ